MQVNLSNSNGFSEVHMYIEMKMKYLTAFDIEKKQH